jgi:hypothetical protein
MFRDTEGFRITLKSSARERFMVISRTRDSLRISVRVRLGLGLVLEVELGYD